MIRVCGYSDDLIDVEGKLLSEEFSFMPNDSGDSRYLAFSDGTLLSCSYDRDGMWRFGVLQKGTSYISKDECLEETKDNHSDVVWIGDDVKWVVFGSELVRARKAP